ncbi:hypothetical protein [Paenibacillus chitinolyticus]|uniref:hypothetical protein n=1 Tax=Paenibacillus chitinolyticus TaxID=79263 RepID=UPI001C47116F|nr:hypothetical protein [Paenibacillus chitinolyticus]MBV6717254.1 hypothetical protein [Paenibacillus chitinolyticus]
MKRETWNAIMRRNLRNDRTDMIEILLKEIELLKALDQQEKDEEQVTSEIINLHKELQLVQEGHQCNWKNYLKKQSKEGTC